MNKMSIPIINEGEYDCIIEKNKHHLNALDDIVRHSSRKVAEGGLFYIHNSFNKHPAFKFKQLNLFSVARVSHYILEIGFNAGHSALVMLLANDTSVITVVDINEHPYVEDCFKYLAQHFPNRLNFYPGKSEAVVSTLQGPFDLFHIDGFSPRS